ncbi:MAG: DNA/RNA nuclease SfsA [Methanosphaera sp.]|uniref:DNA/RNA nuclease SfsA n=1 Tax=Methanosphaera sp. TaxID=2666342 RepID=UPI002E768242|nr:DNA/RNA nuclease SfsA [Methanosphaera sp.]MEE1118243.1 DNA/RNA nuclease SfsA [Methanosphaera sp.]MEE3324664.1 DNA/RNA nuclease SfsA [Methanosphaera sp.]
MKISNLILVKFISRPNRFTIKFKNEKNETELAHLHDPGRLKELLVSNADVLIKYVPTYKKTSRKTKYDVIAIKYQNEWVLLNSSYHNKLVSEILTDKLINEIEDFNIFKPEYSYGNSRLDFLLKDNKDNELFLEVKGCTLVEKGIAKFPDAPTKRGKKHVDELIKIRKKSLNAAIIILVLQNNAKSFTPNYETDKDFSDSLKEAYENNVKIYPIHIKTEYKNNNLLLRYNKILPIKF